MLFFTVVRSFVPDPPSYGYRLQKAQAATPGHRPRDGQNDADVDAAGDPPEGARLFLPPAEEVHAEHACRAAVGGAESSSSSSSRGEIRKKNEIMYTRCLLEIRIISNNKSEAQQGTGASV